MLVEGLERQLASLGNKSTQQKERQRIELQLSRLNYFLQLDNEGLEGSLEVFKLHTHQLGTLGECIDQTGNFWVKWEGSGVPQPEQITNLVPVSRQSLPELKIGQEIETTIDLQKQTATISLFAGDYAVLQINDDFVSVNISQLVTKEELPKSGKSDPKLPLCPPVLAIKDRESYYELPSVTKAEVLLENSYLEKSRPSSYEQDLEKTVWDMTIHYLSNVLKTEQEELTAIVLTWEAKITTHVEAIAAHFPIPQRELALTMIMKAFRELYETDEIASRLEPMPVFSVGDKVQAVGECAIAGGTVALVCNHAIKLQESPSFFLADSFELVADDVTPTPSETPKPTESTEMWLDPKLVILNAGTQSRDPNTWGEPEGIVSEEAVEEYAQLMREGLWDYEQKPLPVAYFDGNVHYASDSHHRTAAAIRAGVELIYEVRSGGLFEAIANSCRSNRKHSKLPLTKSDQRRQIELFLDTLDRATPEQRQKLLESVPRLSDREKSWSCRVIAKYLELSEVGYRTVNNIIAERKQRQLAAELQVGQRVQLSTDQRKLTNFKLLASQVGGCAAKIVDVNLEKLLVKVLPVGLPETSGFCRWVKIDAVSPLAEGVEPFARLIESWQKHLVLDFCASTYRGMTFQYMEGQEVDNTWTAIVRVEQVPVGVVLDYATSFLSIKEIEEKEKGTATTSSSSPEVSSGTSTPAASNGATATSSSTSTPVTNGGATGTSSGASDSSQELSPEDASLATTISNCFELLEFELFGHLDQWLAQSSVTTLERIAQGAEQLTQKVKAALASRSNE